MSNFNLPVLLHKILRGLPIVGSLYRIANAYAFEGKVGSHSKTAPLIKWWDRVLRLAVAVILFILVLIYAVDKPINSWTFDPAATILAIFPSILGFGIGVYALLFIMPKDFFQDLAEKSSERNFGPEIVPVDMGYPLTIFATVMFVGVISEVLDNIVSLKYVALFFLFYGLAMVVELISFLFNSSMMIQKIRSKK